MNKAMLVMSGLLFSPLAVAGQITMTDPQQGNDGERKDALHIPEQHLPVHLRNKAQVPILRRHLTLMMLGSRWDKTRRVF